MKLLSAALCLLVLGLWIQPARANDVCHCKGYNGPGGPCYAGPGGPAYNGPGGPAYSGPGGPCSHSPGGPEYSGPGGPAYSGPGGRDITVQVARLMTVQVVPHTKVRAGHAMPDPEDRAIQDQAETGRDVPRYVDDSEAPPH
jgi:hypothetical protein